MSCDVAIVGAGPYGLAVAAHLRRLKGLSVSVFGEPMRFWRTAMPAGMLLRSPWSASHIADPHASLTLDAYKVSSGNHLAAPISLERFISYGLWYQRAAVRMLILPMYPASSLALESSNFGLRTAVTFSLPVSLSPAASRPSLPGRMCLITSHGNSQHIPPKGLIFPTLLISE